IAEESVEMPKIGFGANGRKALRVDGIGVAQPTGGGGDAEQMLVPCPCDPAFLGDEIAALVLAQRTRCAEEFTEKPGRIEIGEAAGTDLDLFTIARRDGASEREHRG